MRHRATLTLADAELIVAACRAEAERHGWNVSIAVVDDAGHLLAFTRLDGAIPITATVAVEKARTAALTRQPSRAWEDRIAERPVFLKFPDNLPITGGLPLMVDGDGVGGVGVSGVQSLQDEEIARAGVDTLDAPVGADARPERDPGPDRGA